MTAIRTPCTPFQGDFFSARLAEASLIVEGQDPGSIFRSMGGDDDLGDISAIAIAAVADLLEILQVRSPLEVMERTDDFRTALFANRTETLAESNVRLDFQVRETSSGADGHAQAPLCLLGTHFRNAAGGNQGGVGVREKVFYLVVAELAAVQADLRHFHPRVIQDGQYFFVCLMLYAGADHIFTISLQR